MFWWHYMSHLRVTSSISLVLSHALAYIYIITSVRFNLYTYITLSYLQLCWRGDPMGSVSIHPGVLWRQIVIPNNSDAWIQLDSTQKETEFLRGHSPFDQKEHTTQHIQASFRRRFAQPLHQFIRSRPESLETSLDLMD